MTTTVRFDHEPHRNALWSVVAIRGDGTVLALHQFDAPVSDLTRAEVRDKINEIANLPDVAAAHAAFLECEDDDTDDLVVHVAFGMISGGRFTYNFSKGDARKAGISHIERAA